MEKLVYTNIFETVTDTVEEAAELQFRADLMLALRGIFRKNGWSNAEISEALDIPQPRVSELVRGKVHLFSSDRLIVYLAKLNVRFKPGYTDSKVTCTVYEAA